MFSGASHRENLDRVYSRIAIHILAFHDEHRGQFFHAEELRRYVLQHEPLMIAPGSPDRILRQMRLKGMLNYDVINRRASLYQFKELA